MNPHKAKTSQNQELRQPMGTESSSPSERGATSKVGSIASVAATHSAESGTGIERQLFLQFVTAWQRMESGTYRALEIKDSDAHLNGARGREIKLDLNAHPGAEIGFVFWPEGGHRTFLAERPAVFQVIETAFDTGGEDRPLGDDQLPITGRIYSFLDDGTIHIVQETHDASMYETPVAKMDFEEGFYKDAKATAFEDIATLTEILTKINSGEYELLDPETTYAPIDYWGLYEGEWEEVAA